MWGELLLCSSFFRNLTKSSYCVSYFFLLLRTLYLISSYSETVAGGCPTLVLLKRENNAKRGCLCRKIMPCPSYSHMQDRSFFFQGQQPVRNMTAVLALGNTPLCLAVFGNLAFTTARAAGDYWFWALAFYRNYYVNGQWRDTLRGGTHVRACCGQ